jgi:DNA-binding NarL/FixJ family response regulator
MDVVVAVHSREVKTALFVALNGVETVTIVAVAGSTAELVSYCQTFRPDVAIVEAGLPGQPIEPVLAEIEQSSNVERLLVIGDDKQPGMYASIPSAEILKDVEHLLAIHPEFTHEERAQ